ncbi:VWA domain-containing protein [Rubripirellula obstinata]|nr:VWA domain-containing protein [Rubripirellula obstinata]
MMDFGSGIRDVQIGNPAYGLFGWFLAACVAVIVFAVLWRIKARRSLATPSRLRSVLGENATRVSLIRAVLVFLSIGFLVIAAMDIRWGRVSREVPQRGIEVLFALDVSRSMLAEDVAPNRLERAKQMIKDTLAEMAGDSVGLVLFAGESRQVIPITSHYDEFRQRLDSVQPADVYRGGSRLGDAIRVSKKAFLNDGATSKAIVLMTDGEDMESDPIEAAKTAFEEDGVTIFTIGLGDMQQGARIPIQSRTGKQYVQYRGQPVLSKLDGKVLQQIADVAGGDCILAGTKQVNMADFYNGYLAPLPDSIVQTKSVDNYEARFQWFLAPAIALLLLELTIAGRRQG